jgi:transposase
MAMGRNKDRQGGLWIETSKLARGPGHPFYQRLNALLVKQGFDAFVESSCQKFYAEVMGRPSLRPGVYFRLLLVGYFEGIDSERGIAWRVADQYPLSRSLLLTTKTEVPESQHTLADHRLHDASLG